MKVTQSWQKSVRNTKKFIKVTKSEKERHKTPIRAREGVKTIARFEFAV